MFVATIHGQCVLNQIVGANTKKGRLLGQTGRRERRGRRLDHDTDFETRVIGDGLFIQIFHHVPQDELGLADLLEIGHQGKHDLDVAQCRGPQDGP